MEKYRINTAGDGFEKEIWDAACILRGNIDASEYKQVVLGLIFLKYISDRFQKKYFLLIEQGQGQEENPEEYAKEGIFFVPAESRWNIISEHADSPEIGYIIDDALKNIELQNPKLKGILPKHYARPELDKKRLAEIIRLFTVNIKIDNLKQEQNILGSTYEYCLAKFAEQEGKLASEFYTPVCVVKTLVEMLAPMQGTIYDPCCGSGGMFVQTAKYIENYNGDIENVQIYGQDSNPTTRKMAQMNLSIRGIEADLGKHSADIFFEDCHPDLKADFIMANPPFNLADWGHDRLKDDPRWKFGLPPAGNANFAWLQHMLYHLSPNGKIGMILANGSLSSQINGEGEIRKNIIESDLVECVVAMPPHLFYATLIPVSLWILSKDKVQKGKTLFIDARDMGTMVSKKLRELSDGSVNKKDNDIRRIADAYHSYLNGSQKNVRGFCATVTTEEIANKDYILTPGIYVGIEEQQEETEPFELKMGRLTSELSEMFTESSKLEDEIKQKLGAIGYEI